MRRFFGNTPESDVIDNGAAVVTRKKPGFLSRQLDTLCFLGNATTRTLSSPALWLPFLSVKKVHPAVLHLRGWHPLGYTDFNADLAQKLVQKSPKGVTTFWMGPVLFFYITDLEAKRVMIKESIAGVTNRASQEFLKRITGGNNVMATFPDFRRIDSDSYHEQRRFLLNVYHTRAHAWLSMTSRVTEEFLRGNTGEFALRELLTRLILRTSSHLLGLTEKTLDLFYDEHYRDAINRIAIYGISQKLDLAFEKELYALFCDILKSNFGDAFGDTTDGLIRNIFSSLEVCFPVRYEDFERDVPEAKRYEIAMNFMSTALGGMVHSTVSTFDFALAHLLDNPEKHDEFQRLMYEHPDLDLSDRVVFEKGPLLPICRWIEENVFLNPPFSHEFFYNQKTSVVKLGDGSEFAIPQGSVTIVNYRQCNLNSQFPETESAGAFVHSKDTGSFGGSVDSNSRVCPAARTSLYEQMVMLAVLCRDYQLTPSPEMSCDVDSKQFPLCIRVNAGRVHVESRMAQSSVPVSTPRGP